VPVIGRGRGQREDLPVWRRAVGWSGDDRIQRWLLFLVIHCLCLLGTRVCTALLMHEPDRESGCVAGDIAGCVATTKSCVPLLTNIFA
jgi:hypothetical protein